jgi:cytochrome c-type biogenesis protein CcmH/NrfG
MGVRSHVPRELLSFTVKFSRKSLITVLVVLAAYALFLAFGYTYEYYQRDNTKILTTNQLQTMAREQLRSGNHEAALYSAASCIEIEDDNYNCWMYAGMAAYKTGNCEDAVAAFSQAATLDVPESNKQTASDLLTGVKGSSICVPSGTQD